MLKENSYFRSSFAKGILLITGGSFFAQIINVVLSPIITRVYSPEEFGVLSVYASILGILSVFSSLKYEATIAIAEDEEVAFHMLVLSIIILTLTTSILIAVLILLINFSIVDITYLNNYIILIPVGLFFVGLYNILIQWALRYKEFKTIAKTKLSQSIIQNIIKILMGISNFGSMGLIVGQIAGTSAGFLSFIKLLFKDKKGESFKKLKLKSLLWGAKRYIKFPIYSTPSQLLNIAGIQLPTLFLAFFFGSSVTGQYSLANSMINLPFEMIGRSVSDVFFSETARIGKENPHKIKGLSNKLLIRLLIIGFIPLLIILIFSSWIFSFVFGTEWYEAGLYAKLIVILVFFRFIFMPISRVFEVFERQREAFYLDLSRITLVLIVFGVSLYLQLNPYWAVGLYSIAMSIVYFNTYLMSRKILNEEIKKIDNKNGSNLVS